MEPRRSTRAASAKPLSKAAPPEPSRAPRTASKKRAASEPDRAPPPAPKRTKKGEEQNVAPTAKKPNSRVAGTTVAAEQKKSRAPKLAPIAEGEAPAAEVKPSKPPHVQIKSYLNPLPCPPEKIRPGLQLFVWGAGNFGQFGLGPDVLNELDKPKKNSWAEQQMEKGTFGEEGAGLEEVAGGGMHSLFIDEKGTV